LEVLIWIGVSRGKNNNIAYRILKLMGFWMNFNVIHPYIETLRYVNKDFAMIFEQLGE
jgi:hypothetical protein